MRYRRVILSGDMLVTIFSEGQGDMHLRLVKHGLPVGTRFAYVIPSPNIGIDVVVEHDTFDDLQHGDLIPVHPSPMFEKIPPC